MATSKSYPVTVVEYSQPHLVISHRDENVSYIGWLCCTCLGIAAIALILCLFLVGGSKLFMTPLDPYSGLVPTIKQGNMRVFPSFSMSEDGICSTYYVELPPQNVTHTVKTLETLLKKYPKSQGPDYKNCWLDYPDRDHPCFFNSSWINEVCPQDHSFGYEVNKGHFNPCFIMELENTTTWVPLKTEKSSLPKGMQYDPGFLPVLCSLKGSKPEHSLPNITIFPAKGFAHLYFPESNFDAEAYLHPLVAVRLEGIRTGRNVTVECSIITPNSFLLWNNGKAKIHFISS